MAAFANPLHANPFLTPPVLSHQELRATQEQLRELVLEKQAQDELLRQRERELAALKGALKEEVASHDQEVEELKQQFQANVVQLQKEYEEAFKVRIWPP